MAAEEFRSPGFFFFSFIYLFEGVVSFSFPVPLNVGCSINLRPLCSLSGMLLLVSKLQCCFGLGETDIRDGAYYVSRLPRSHKCLFLICCPTPKCLSPSIFIPSVPCLELLLLDSELQCHFGSGETESYDGTDVFGPSWSLFLGGSAFFYSAVSPKCHSSINLSSFPFLSVFFVPCLSWASPGVTLVLYSFSQC